MKPQISYRKRRDLMLKNFSSFSITNSLGETILRSGILIISRRGRPCEVKKEKLLGFLLFAKLCGDGYEQMELDSKLFLKRHYDHGTFQYHYTALDVSVIIGLTAFLEKKIKEQINEVLLHIFDSTALSTSVREERTRQGTRNKEKLTTKFHTMMGYDPPFQLVFVEGMLASSKHISDAQGARIILNGKDDVKGYGIGDSAFETYDLIDDCISKDLEPLFKPTVKDVGKKLSAKAQLRKVWNGNHSRIYGDIRGSGECLYGGATRAGLIHTNSIREDNQEKDSLIIGLRQNLFTYLRLKALIRIIRKSHLFSKI
jgi:hypothetical protein